MNFKRILNCMLLACLPYVYTQAQEENTFVHEQSKAEDYVWPDDPQVLKNLRHWQDQKFGILIHWGLYSVPGIVESWSICSEDWITRSQPNYQKYKEWYWGLSKQFNPVNFNPDKWADVMKAGGAKYVIFTTKHHDGFCMYDSKYTDFSIAKGPFANNPRRDVANEVFKAFRKKDFMIGCYYSKPDWHSQWFWNDYYATPNRQINYKKEQHPDWWQNYRKFAQNQLNELTTNYGKLDILWLDGGWITGDEIGLDTVLVGARQRNPGLICVDRTIRGKNENYQTPEQNIPGKQLNYPWESCITLTDNWGWVPNSRYKSPARVIDMLAQITAKGGCLVLGIGPKPDGTIGEQEISHLNAIGAWLKTNGTAIYNTVTTPHYNDGQVWFTANKDKKTLYAIYAVKDGEQLPAVIRWTTNFPKGSMTLLQNGRKVKYAVKGNTVEVTVPKGTKAEPLVFKFQQK